MKNEDGQQEPSQNTVLRVIALIGWLLVFYIGTNMLVGAIVGGISGGSTSTFNEGYVAGQQASVDFSRKYGNLVLSAQIVVFVALAYLGKFPGTSKYKK